MNIGEAIASLVQANDLTRDDMSEVMTAIMHGKCSDAQIAGFLVALAAKGETMDEITAAADVMRSLSVKVALSDADAIDVVGTGGDGLKTVNVSTASAIVVASCGITVAKHGNRAASSSSGSADLLELAGVPMVMSPEAVKGCIDRTGIGFMFAPNHHPAMKHAIGPRKELNLRTVFNYIGPLTNPAGVRRMLLGVSNANILRPMVGALDALGFDRAMVVHADDGMDELSIAAPTSVASLQHGQIEEYRISPDEVGLQSYDISEIIVSSAEESLDKITRAFQGVAGATRDVIALNAGAALSVAEKVDDIEAGVKLAQAAMDDGHAAAKLKEWVRVGKELVDGA